MTFRPLRVKLQILDHTFVTSLRADLPTSGLLDELKRKTQSTPRVKTIALACDRVGLSFNGQVFEV